MPMGRTTRAKGHGLFTIVGATCLLVLPLSGCEQKAPAPAPGVAGQSSASQPAAPQRLAGEVKIDGSSTVYPIAAALAEEFQNEQQGVSVPVAVSGTGSGMKRLLRGEIDIANASRPITEGEIQVAKENGIEFIELPIAFDALTVVVHPSNTFVDTLTIDELKTIWAPESEKKVMRWNQVRSSWPDAPLTLFGAGTASGTFDYFTEAVTGKARASRADYTQSEDDNTLVVGVGGDKHALGYFGYAYYVSSKEKLRAVPIINPKGEAIMPSEASVLDGTYAPLARPVFMYINRKSLLEKPQVRGFAEFLMTKGAPVVSSVKYVPLPESAYQKGLERIRGAHAGTAFGGHSMMGMHIDELFKRPLSGASNPDTEHTPEPTKPAGG